MLFIKRVLWECVNGEKSRLMRMIRWPTDIMGSKECSDRDDRDDRSC